MMMNLPTIDLASLPDLPGPIGLFGSTLGPGFDDTLIILYIFLYEISLPSGLIG